MRSDYEAMMMGKLKDHLHDTIDSDLSSSEIHQSIIDAVQEDIDYFQSCIDKRKQLMSLLVNNKTYILTVQEDPVSGELYLNLPNDIPWKEGDVVEWIVQNDNSILIKKCN